MRAGKWRHHDSNSLLSTNSNWITIGCFSLFALCVSVSELSLVKVKILKICHVRKVLKKNRVKCLGNFKFLHQL